MGRRRGRRTRRRMRTRGLEDDGAGLPDRGALPPDARAGAPVGRRTFMKKTCRSNFTLCGLAVLGRTQPPPAQGMKP